jgi:hypothetical protein
VGELRNKNPWTLDPGVFVCIGLFTRDIFGCPFVLVFGLLMMFGCWERVTERQKIKRLESKTTNPE